MAGRPGEVTAQDRGRFLLDDIDLLVVEFSLAGAGPFRL